MKIIYVDVSKVDNNKIINVLKQQFSPYSFTMFPSCADIVISTMDRLISYFVKHVDYRTQLFYLDENSNLVELKKVED